MRQVPGSEQDREREALHQWTQRWPRKRACAPISRDGDGQMQTDVQSLLLFTATLQRFYLRLIRCLGLAEVRP